MTDEQLKNLGNVCENITLRLGSTLRLDGNRIKEIIDDLLKCREALRKIACFEQGDVVTGSFDDPATAIIAREALSHEVKGEM